MDGKTIPGEIMRYLTLSLMFLTACNEYKDDNVIEEIVEQSIKENIGIDIDLTPETPEEHGLKQD